MTFSAASFGKNALDLTRGDGRRVRLGAARAAGPAHGAHRRGGGRRRAPPWPPGSCSGARSLIPNGPRPEPRSRPIASRWGPRTGIRPRPSARGCGPTACAGVTVDTANRLQGREFDVVIVLHPLSGRRDATAFHLEAGRLCVLTTRHRHACIVVARAGIPELLDAHPSTEPVHLNVPVKFPDGWEANQSVLAHLQQLEGQSALNFADDRDPGRAGAQQRQFRTPLRRNPVRLAYVAAGRAEQNAEVNAPTPGHRLQDLRRLVRLSEPGGDGLSHELADMCRITLTMVEDPGGGLSWFLNRQVVGNSPMLVAEVTAQVQADIGIPGLDAAEHDELVCPLRYVANSVDRHRAGARDDRVRFGEPLARTCARREPQPRGVDVVVRAHTGTGNAVQAMPCPQEPAATHRPAQVVVIRSRRDRLGARDEPALTSGGVRNSASEFTLPHTLIMLQTWFL